jgi:hypothetical protein
MRYYCRTMGIRLILKPRENRQLKADSKQQTIDSREKIEDKR